MTNIDQTLAQKIIPAAKAVMGNPELMVMTKPGIAIPAKLKKEIEQYFGNEREMKAFVKKMTNIMVGDTEKQAAVKAFLEGKVPEEVAGFDPKKFLEETAQEVAKQSDQVVGAQGAEIGLSAEVDEPGKTRPKKVEVETKERIEAEKKRSYDLDLGIEREIRGLEGFAPKKADQTDVKSQIESAKTNEMPPQTQKVEIPSGRMDAKAKREKKKTTKGTEDMNKQYQEAEAQRQAAQAQANQAAAAFMAGEQAAAQAAQQQAAAQATKKIGMSGMAKAGLITGGGIAATLGGGGALYLFMKLGN